MSRPTTLAKLRNTDINYLNQILDKAPFEAVAWNEQTRCFTGLISPDEVNDLNNGWVLIAELQIVVDAHRLVQQRFSGDIALALKHAKEIQDLQPTLNAVSQALDLAQQIALLQSLDKAP